jgi:hypothetical protein
VVECVCSCDCPPLSRCPPPLPPPPLLARTLSLHSHVVPTVQSQEEDLRVSALKIREITHHKAIAATELTAARLAADSARTELDELRKRHDTSDTHQLGEQLDSAKRRHDADVRRLQAELDAVRESSAAETAALRGELARVKSPASPAPRVEQRACQTDAPYAGEYGVAGPLSDSAPMARTVSTGGANLAELLAFGSDTDSVPDDAAHAHAAEAIAMAQAEAETLRAELEQLHAERDEELSALRDEFFRLRAAAVESAAASVRRCPIPHHKRDTTHHTTPCIPLNLAVCTTCNGAVADYCAFASWLWLVSRGRTPKSIGQQTQPRSPHQRPYALIIRHCCRAGSRGTRA